MRKRGKAQSAELLGNDHAQEASILDELPHVRRQVLVDVGRLPVAGHAAQCVDFMVEEALFFVGQCRPRRIEQPPPVRAAGEEFAVPPYRAGFERITLGLRHRRHQLAECRQHAIADQLAPQRLELRTVVLAGHLHLVQRDEQQCHSDQRGVEDDLHVGGQIAAGRVQDARVDQRRREADRKSVV